MGEVRLSESDVVFVEATPEQRRLSWRLNSASWAPPMTNDQYIEREETLSRTQLTKSGGGKYWILHKRDDPLTIVASCETVRKTVFVRRPASSSNAIVATSGDGASPSAAVVEELAAYGIASVYTNPDFRRLGMANLMLQRLQDFMDGDGAACSALYSDVGKVYYANLGWDVFPHDEATLHLLRDDRRIAPDSCCDVKTRFLEREEISGLCDADVADLKTRLQRVPEDGKTTLVAFSPSYAQIEWHLIREEQTCAALFPSANGGGTSRTLENRGAITLDGRSWVLWEHDAKRKQLLVLRIVTTKPDSEARRVDHIWALMGAAVAEASNWGLKAVVVWNPDDTTTSGIKATSNAYLNDVKVVFTVREGSLPSLRWRERDTTKKTWVDNFRYAWC